MTGMDREWTIGQIDSFTHMTDYVASTSPGVIGSFSRGRQEEIAGQAQVVERILERATPGWWSRLRETSRKLDGLREAASRGHTQLQREQELLEKLGDDAPASSAADLHHWIWGGARSLWQSGHFVQTVRDAVTKLNAEIQNKVGRRDVSETDQFKQSFSTDVAKPGKSRLRRMPLEDSNTSCSVQRGAMSFAEGVFAGIRNPLSDEADQELDEQVALEYPAALSVLARWVDESTVEHAGESL